MTNRAIPFNGSIGVTSYMGPGVLSGATLTSPTLNLDVDSCYEFEGSAKANASATIDFFLNSDTTSANYDRAVTSNSGATPTSATANNSLIATVAAGDMVRFSGKLFKDCEGHPCLEMSYGQLSTTSLKSSKVSIVWRTTGTNVISFKFQQSTGSLTSGSMTVRKQSPLTALNNATNLDVTAWPSNPVNGQRARRTNTTGGMRWGYFDSSLGVWLSEQDYSTPGMSLQNGYGVTTIAAARFRQRQDYDIYVYKVSIATFVQTTTNSTNYWSYSCSAPSFTTFDTKTDTPSVFQNHDQSPNAILPVSGGNKEFEIRMDKVGAPGQGYIIAELHYRLVIP